MYIDKHEVEIKGTKYDEKTNKSKKDQLLVSYNSSEGMTLKKLIPLLEELVDTHEANCKISLKITMEQHQY